MTPRLWTAATAVSLAHFTCGVSSWSPSLFKHGRLSQTQARMALSMTEPAVDDDIDFDCNKSSLNRRRKFLATGAAVTFGTLLTVKPPNSNALIKGNAPPPKMKPRSSSSDRPKCTSIDECEALGAKREQERQEAESRGPPPLVTAKGTRYRDMELGDTDGDAVQVGDEVTIFYKVLKLGKRSYDGISGEGTVVFSKGYGLEDDEDKAGVKSFITTVGAPQNILALNDAVVGMHREGIRRFAVLPQAGWEKPTKLCDGGPGGQGAGGELKTDYVVVPTATMVSTESCFDQSKLPFPTTFAEQRRMAQRFDQSLLMEVQVVGINKNPSIPL